MTHFTRALLLLALASTLLTACYLHADGVALEDRVSALEQRNDALREQLQAERAQLEALLAEARAELALLETALEEARSTTVRGIANLGSRLEGFEHRLHELNGLIEVLSHRFAESERRFRAIDSAIEDLAGCCS